ncbi:Multidrug resistance-associated protein 1 [Colletotrichum tanaceti]|uniref:Multidrug resistance-associated protein 1 n=1 Tax=Colletotrichum tanaceti TaxID=1306861 RepID=A0A4U6XSU8_9PEZI|nr:Multidrug resistance-associated protein 1 [Colletotrichum tanaceti]
MNNVSNVCHDELFGPAVATESCRGGFDFTVLFEESVLSIPLSAGFLLIAPIQVALVFKAVSAARPSLRLSMFKLVLTLVYAGLHLSLLILWASGHGFTTRATLASSVLSLCAALALAVLSQVQHRKSIRPCFIITGYLIVSLFLNGARVRTAWLLASDKHLMPAILTAALAVQVLILGLETKNKRKILAGAYRSFSREATSGLLSRGLFWWLRHLLSDGSRRILTVEDLESINEKLASSKLSSELQVRWMKTNHTRHKHALALATLSAWRLEVAKIALPRLCQVALSLAQPFLIRRIVEAISAPVSQQTWNQGYGLIGAVALVYTGIPIATGFYQHLSFRLMAMIRGGLISLIYEKIAQSPSTQVGDSAAMTLISTDVERICETWHLVVAESWSSVIQLAFAVWFLQMQLGPVCVTPVIIALVATAMSVRAAGFVTARQKVWLEAIQVRINFTAHTLGSMRSVKMLGLSNKFESLIQGMRVTELDLSKRFRRLSSFNVCLVNLPSLFSQFFTFAIFAIAAKVQGNSFVTVSQAVTSLSIISILMQPLGTVLVVIPQAYAALGCFQRIQEFLASESWDDNRLPERPLETTSLESQDKSDTIQTPSGSNHVEMIQHPQSTTPKGSLPRTISNSDRVVIHKATVGWRGSSHVIKDMSLCIGQHHHLTVILGPVGCGKSTLLKAILGEATICNGSVWTSSKELAYCDQSPWVSNGSVRENIVSGTDFDAAWYNTVLHACALQVDLLQLSDGDATNVGSKGVSLSGGQKQRLTLARALYSRKPIAILDDVLSGLDAATHDIVTTRVFGADGLIRKLGMVAILATHSVSLCAVADQTIILDDQGQITQQSSSENMASLAPQPAGDDGSSASPGDSPLPKISAGETQGSSTTKRDDNRQVGDLSIYLYYFSSMGWLSLALFGIFVASNVAFGTLQYAWITLWAQSSDGSQASRLGYWLGLFLLFSVFTAAGLISAVYYMYVVIVPKSAQSLHLSVLRAVIRAPMSFLAETDTGALVNRFSQDMQLVDMTLPGALQPETQSSRKLVANVRILELAACFAVAAMAIVAVSYFAAVLPFVACALYFLQRFYLRTSRQLRLLDLEAKAPLYSHVLESLQGIATIRAYGWTSNHVAKNLALLDRAQKPYYLLLCIQRWLTFVLGLTVAGLAILLTTLGVTLRSRLDAGFLGVALVSMMSLGQSLAALITFWTSLETSLGAISRVKTFSEDTPAEKPREIADTGALAGWPSQGSVVIENWSAHYNGHTVLRNIDIAIQAGEKVALCGRTGSGKTSLLLSLLGMVEESTGRIVLDDVDLALVPKDVTRQRLTCLTQDPFLFAGSVRLNADPHGEATDADIISALQKVGLWDVFRSKESTETSDPLEFSILDMKMEEDFLSQGQRKLFCLGRALLRKSPVLVLDEPSSGVDTSTESSIEAIVESEFATSTVIMATHSLAGVRKFDKVAVLDGGVLLEYGEPEELLARVDGAFAKLYAVQRGRPEASSA